MAAPWEKSYRVLEYHTSKSVVTVQRAFRAKYAKDPDTDKPFVCSINNLLKLGVCVCKQKAPMLKLVWQELEYRIDVCRVNCCAQIENL